ncbi:hypothetical protein [Burkholderia stagnalis]|uniref:hypothetical protein n=1 Tax=Burkholderia stagnalis TaxID=1503054 RepID=UPI000F564256|nr:hypothetical protein [Burkholderia stagnalis]
MPNNAALATALQQLVQAVEYTPLGIRSLKAVAAAKEVLGAHPGQPVVDDAARSQRAERARKDASLSLIPQLVKREEIAVNRALREMCDAMATWRTEVEKHQEVTSREQSAFCDGYEAGMAAMLSTRAVVAQVGAAQVDEQRDAWTRSEIDELLSDADRLGKYPGKAAATLFDCARVIRALLASRAMTDTTRLDWLCEHVVNVRLPLPYGSREMFWASPSDDDAGHKPSDLRAKIDAASAGENRAA